MEPTCVEALLYSETINTQYLFFPNFIPTCNIFIPTKTVIITVITFPKNSVISPIELIAATLKALATNSRKACLPPLQKE